MAEEVKRAGNAMKTGFIIVSLMALVSIGIAEETIDAEGLHHFQFISRKAASTLETSVGDL